MRDTEKVTWALRVSRRHAADAGAAPQYDRTQPRSGAGDPVALCSVAEVAAIISIEIRSARALVGEGADSAGVAELVALRDHDPHAFVERLADALIAYSAGERYATAHHPQPRSNPGPRERSGLDLAGARPAG